MQFLFLAADADAGEQGQDCFWWIGPLSDASGGGSGSGSGAPAACGGSSRGCMWRLKAKVAAGGAEQPRPSRSREKISQVFKFQRDGSSRQHMDIRVPEELQPILRDFTKAVLRERPDDVLQFSRDYFVSKWSEQRMSARAHAHCTSAPLHPGTARRRFAVRSGLRSRAEHLGYLWGAARAPQAGGGGNIQAV